MDALHMRSLGGIVLAGGRGRRLGGPKATAALAGSTLVELAVRVLASRCADVVVVTREGVSLPHLPARIVLDRPGPAAPLVAVATGLAALETDDCLVLACDLPLSAPVVDRLLRAPPGVAAVAVGERGRAQALCARYPRAPALAACERLLATGRLAMRDLLDALRPARVAADERELLNVNAPADLAQADAALRSGYPAGSTSTTAL